MTTRKLLAFVLSVLMIISVMPTTIFAAPTAVTAGDTAHEHNHNHFPEEPAVLSSDLDLTTLYIDISSVIEEGKTVKEVRLWVSGEGESYLANEKMNKIGKNVYSYDVTQAVAQGGLSGSYAIFYTDDTSLTHLYDNFVTGKNLWVASGIYSGSWDVFGDVTGNMVITMYDSYGDSWNGASIEIYENSTLFDTITVEADSNTYSFAYNELSTYTFKWRKGISDDECEFVIKLGEDVLYTIVSASVFYDGEEFYVIESKCEHDVSEPGGVCSVCSNVCGTNFPHKIDENLKCSVCSFECGVTAEHDWSDKNGVCKVCKTSCPEHDFDENNICTICGIESSCEHDWTNKDGVCKVCGYECPGHTFDENNTCTICGFLNAIVITMVDRYGDSWNNAAIEVYKDDALVDTITVNSNKNTYTLSYDKTSRYSFKWKKGYYDNECQFSISLGATVLKNVDNASEFTDGEVIYTIEPKCEHSVEEPCGVCALCSKVCGTDFAHEFDENDVCSICGHVKAIIITMTDSFGDSWDDAAIEVYKYNVLVDTITVDVDTNTYTLPYDKLSEYTFKWKEGNYDSECSFVISLDIDVLKTVDNASVFADGEIIYTIESKCEHDVSEPCGACSVCSKVCGTDFLHKTDENHKCSVCSFECGVTAEHDWSDKNGVCKVCGYECYEHSFDENYACTICAYTYKALVTSEDGTSSIVYEFIDEALEAAESLENCTVKLLNNASVTTACTIDSGKFTIDLNGKTWECSEWVLYVGGTADIKITDSTGEGGLMKNNVSGCYLIKLYDTAKLEIAGGSFESLNTVVEMSNNLEAVSSELLISGGKIKGHTIVSALGSKITITDGEFETIGGFSITYEAGTLDLSQYANADKISFYIHFSVDVSTLNLILPEGVVLKDFYTEEEVTQLEANKTYAIAKASGSETAMVASVTTQDGTTTTEYASIGGALTAAASLENSTVKLLDNISATTSCTIDSGKFTIDLNGKTWESSQWVLFVRGTADIKITDSIGEGGLMKTTVATCDLIALYDTAKLEIAGGSFESLNYVVDMSDSGLASSSELIISGGKLSGYAIVNAKGSKVTITDGECEEFDLYSICYATGTLDLSQYADADKIVLFVDYSADVSTLNLIFPEGFVLKNLNNNEEATQLEVSVFYTIAKASGSETAMAASVTTQDGTTTTEYASIGEALAAAASLENSTVKLLDNVTTTDYYTIESGKFTIDLNGKIWQSSDVLLYINGTSQIKICDSSENADGLMTTSGNALIVLMDETKLEIESGNFSCTGNYIFNMSNSGMETSSELLISGGWFVGNSVASVAGRKATINSGEFDCAWGYPFEYLYGTLDLSNYKGASEMGFFVPNFIDALALELILPESAIIINCYTEEIVTELASDVEYRIEFSEISSIEINLGEKADETNVRYVEIGGVVTEIEETDNKHLVEIGEENLLVEVTEKTQSGEFVKSQYFYVDMTAKTATKLNMDSYMTADNNTSIRTSGSMGIRFKSSVLTSAKNEEVEYVIDEYGFIVATEEALGEEQLTFDFSRFVTGVAYNKESSTDIVFDATSDEMHIFTGYVKNIPVKNYKTNLVCKTYTKITVGGEQFVVYGEKVVGNVYDTAKALLEDDTLDTDTKNALYKIIFDYENTAQLPGDDLFQDA